MLDALVRRLAERGPEALAALSPERRLAAWCAAVDELSDRASPPRRKLDTALPARCGLSPEGLDAALEVVLEGVTREPAEALFAGARSRPSPPGLAVVVLASNIPGLAVQPLLPALALGCPVLLKSASAEPLFASALVEALVRREPRLADAYGAVTWPGGEREVEERIFGWARRVIAYGGAETMRDLEARVGAKLVAYGPKASLAVVGADAPVDGVAAGLARDVALFDQRGCLSLQAVWTDGDAVTLARALGAALAEAAARWPPGPADPRSAAAVQQERATAAMRGLAVVELELAAGTVVVEPEPELVPSPGLRLVRVHQLGELAELPRLLAPWAGRLQGAVLAGDGAWRLRPALEGLGVARCAAPGELQDVDATWANGGLDPLDAFAEPFPISRSPPPPRTPARDRGR